MFKSFLKQAKPLTFSLQFFAEPGDLGGSPSSVVSNTEPVTQSQAPTMPDVTGQSQGGQTPEQQLQAALRGMNEAQREAAEWKKVGFGNTNEAVQAYQLYQQIQTDPSSLVQNYLQQNQNIMLEMLRQNPMQAAQIFGQVFNNQQPQISPYENVTTYDELGNIVAKQSAETALNQVSQRYDSRLSTIENFMNQQYENSVKAQMNPKIPENMRDQVWEKVKQIGIPMQTIEAQPWVLGGLIVELSGGLDKYGDSIRTNAGQTAVNQYRQDVQTNARTAALSPTGGTVAGEIPKPLEGESLRKAGQTMLAGLIAAQKQT